MSKDSHYPKDSQGKYRFQLEKAPKPHGTCPDCGAKGKFRFYEGFPHELGYGRCERINHHNPPYHVKPPPDAKPMFSSNGATKTAPVKILRPKPELYNPILKNQSSALHKAVTGLNIPAEHFQKWNIGTNDKATAFVFQNKAKQFVNIKFIRYDNTGHRIKSYAPYYAKPSDKRERYETCLFGEHLLTDKTICLVESEKTAFIAAYFYPVYDWLATASASGLTGEKVAPLHNRKVYYIPDADTAGRNNSTIKTLKAYGIDFTVIDLFPARNDGYDLADAIMDGQKPEINPPLTEEEKFLIELDAHCVDMGKPVPKPEQRIAFEGATIATGGYIQVATGESKSGKTALFASWMAQALSPSFSGMGFTVAANKSEKFLLHIDGELAGYDHFNSVANIIKRAAIDKPTWFRSQSLRYITKIQRRREAFEMILERYADKFGGVSAVYIDGIADMVNSVNDEVECNDVVGWLEAIAMLYDCPIPVVLHYNPNTDKSRGHLGSQLERKCQSMLTVSKGKDGISTIEGKLLRSAGVIPSIRFYYDIEKGYHVPAGTFSKEDLQQVKLEKYAKDAKAFLDGGLKQLKRGELCAMFESANGISKRTAESRITTLLQAGILQHNPTFTAIKYVI